VHQHEEQQQQQQQQQPLYMKPPTGCRAYVAQEIGRIEKL
jgi:hypothetical protein